MAYVNSDDDWFVVKAAPLKGGYDLIALLDHIGNDVRKDLELAFQSKCLTPSSLRETLQQCEGALKASRYSYEKNENISKYSPKYLMDCSEFLAEFVAKLVTREWIAEP